MPAIQHRRIHPRCQPASNRLRRRKWCCTQLDDTARGCIKPLATPGELPRIAWLGLGLLLKICKENHQAPTYNGVKLILGRTTKSIQFCRLQSASEAKIKFYMITTNEFVLSINSCWNAASDNLFLRGVRINPLMLKRRSTGAEEGKEV